MQIISTVQAILKRQFIKQHYFKVAIIREQDRSSANQIDINLYFYSYVIGQFFNSDLFLLMYSITPVD
jgi:hypothetical protein